MSKFSRLAHTIVTLRTLGKKTTKDAGSDTESVGRQGSGILTPGSKKGDESFDLLRDRLEKEEAERKERAELRDKLAAEGRDGGMAIVFGRGQARDPTMRLRIENDKGEAIYTLEGKCKFEFGLRPPTFAGEEEGVNEDKFFSYDPFAEGFSFVLLERGTMDPKIVAEKFEEKFPWTQLANQTAASLGVELLSPRPFPKGGKTGEDGEEGEGEGEGQQKAAAAAVVGDDKKRGWVVVGGEGVPPAALRLPPGRIFKKSSQKVAYKIINLPGASLVVKALRVEGKIRKIDATDDDGPTREKFVGFFPVGIMLILKSEMHPRPLYSQAERASRMREKMQRAAHTAHLQLVSRLFQIRIILNKAKGTLMPKHYTSLNTHHVFVLDTTEDVYIWSGRLAPVPFRNAATPWVKALRAAEIVSGKGKITGKKLNIINIRENFEPPRFWILLGSQGPIAQEGQTGELALPAEIPSPRKEGAVSELFNDPPTVCIIGGGPTGAACARMLTDYKCDVTVLDTGFAVGGRIRSARLTNKKGLIEEKVMEEFGGGTLTTACPFVAFRHPSLKNSASAMASEGLLSVLKPHAGIINEHGAAIPFCKETVPPPLMECGACGSVIDSRTDEVDCCNSLFCALCAIKFWGAEEKREPEVTCPVCRKWTKRRSYPLENMRLRKAEEIRTHYYQRYKLQKQSAWSYGSHPRFLHALYPASMGLGETSSPYVGATPAGIASIVEKMLEGIRVRLRTRVHSIERTFSKGRYGLKISRVDPIDPKLTGKIFYEMEKYDIVLVCTPSKPAAKLLKKWCPHLAKVAKKVKMMPVWTVHVTFPFQIPSKLDLMFVDGFPPLNYASREGNLLRDEFYVTPPSKESNPDSRDSWVLIATPYWSAENTKMAPALVVDILLGAFGAALNLTPSQTLPADHLSHVSYRNMGIPSAEEQYGRVATALLWEDGHVPVPLCARPDHRGTWHLFDKGYHIGCAGDWCVDGSVEGAILSGQALAMAVIDMIGPAMDHRLLYRLAGSLDHQTQIVEDDALRLRRWKRTQIQMRRDVLVSASLKRWIRYVDYFSLPPAVFKAKDKFMQPLRMREVFHGWVNRIVFKSEIGNTRRFFKLWTSVTEFAAPPRPKRPPQVVARSAPYMLENPPKREQPRSWSGYSARKEIGVGVLGLMSNKEVKKRIAEGKEVLGAEGYKMLAPPIEQARKLAGNKATQKAYYFS